MTTVKCTLQAVRQRIAEAAAAAGRDASQVALLAVSKSVPAAAIRELALQGQTDFGESYVQEALDKIVALQDLSLVWHFIGPIQRNKTAAIARNFDWVHSVDRQLVAERLSATRPLEREALNVCVQVNIDGEPGKQGVAPQHAAALVEAIGRLPNLRLRGLMAIPRATSDFGEQRASFAALRQLRDMLNRAGAHLDTLSMGMSGDLEAAVMEGANFVRVGTALFGARAGNPLGVAGVNAVWEMGLSQNVHQGDRP